MDPLWIVAAVLGGYLLGSLSFARIITRLASGEDVTQFEIPVANSDDSYKVKSVGGNSVASKLGAKYGFLTGVLDMLKVVVIVLPLKLLFPGQPYHLMAALAGMAGHVWPVYYKFHGGSGWSPAFGSLLVIDWLGALLAPIIGLLFGMLIVRDVTVSIISWMWFVIPWLWFRTYDVWHLAFAIGINVLFILAMIPDIRLMLKYKAEGREMDYGRGNLNSNPMGRGFLKIAKYMGVKLP